MKTIEISNGRNIYETCKEAAFATSKIIPRQMPCGWTSAIQQTDDYTLEIITKLDDDYCIQSQFMFNQQIRIICQIHDQKEVYFDGELIFEEE